MFSQDVFAVQRVNHLFISLTQVYITGLMIPTILIIMLLTMGPIFYQLKL